ncbi:MAG: hypothetical protein ACK40G_12045 [Cytophagaceae bacterium]
MALIDTGNKETIYGAEGVAYIFSSQYKFVRCMLKCKILKFVFTFLYHLIAYNRYIIATPKSRFVCDCFPDRIIQYRLGYIILILSAIVGLSSLTTFVPGEIDRTMIFKSMILFFPVAFVQILFVILFRKEKGWDHAGHLFTVNFVSIALFLPFLFAGILFPGKIDYLIVIGVTTSVGVMIFLYSSRLRFLDMSPLWLILWIINFSITQLLYLYHAYN